MARSSAGLAARDASGLYLLAILLIGTYACGPPSPRSVVLITIETLRADHTSAHGYVYPTTPAIDRLAARGLRFAYAFSASSSTAPSHASIFTGRYPSWHTIGSFNGRYELHPSHVTLAEVLRSAGYRTAAIVGNPMLGRQFGWSQGFDLYDDRLEERELNRSQFERHADRAVDLSLEWLSQVANDRFFLWLHLQDPHGPYVPPRGWSCPLPERDETGPILPLGEDQSGHMAIPRYQVYKAERGVASYERRYDCEITFADQELGRLLGHLERESRFRNTLIIVTADHGEAFGEDGFFFAHGQTIGLDQVHVPLVLAGPGVPAGVTSEVPVSNLAIFATVLDYLDLDTTEMQVGRSLLELSSSEEAPPVFVECLNQVGSVYANAFLRRDRRPASDTEFWNSGNPNAGAGGFWKPLGEAIIQPLNPAESTPDEAKELIAEKLEAFESRAESARAACDEIRSGVILSPERRDALRSLGYLD